MTQNSPNHGLRFSREIAFEGTKDSTCPKATVEENERSQKAKLLDNLKKFNRAEEKAKADKKAIEETCDFRMEKIKNFIKEGHPSYYRKEKDEEVEVVESDSSSAATPTTTTTPGGAVEVHV